MRMKISQDEIKEALIDWAEKKGFETPKLDDISFEMIVVEGKDEEGDDTEWDEVEATLDDAVVDLRSRR